MDSSKLRTHAPFAGSRLKPVPNGCGQQRWPERRSSLEACAQVDTPRVEAATDWGHIAECPDFGELPGDFDPHMPRPDWWFVAILGVAAFSAVAACVVIAHHLPLI